MSILASDAKTIRNQIRADLVAAWPDVLEVIDNDPRHAARPPYAVVALRSVPMSFSGAVMKDATLNWQIYGRFPFPASGSLEDAKLDRVQALMDRLEAAATYASVGLLPIVTNANFAEDDDEDEPAYEVEVEFTVRTDRPHGAA